MKRLFLATAILAASVAGALAQPIGGSYAVEGTGLNGSPYTGVAEIVRVSDTTCAIRWDTGGQISEGLCMRYGSAFAASYSLGSAVGLVIYEVMDDGSMEGIWTVTGQNGNGTERLTPR